MTELVVGCPVRRREWIIDDWFDHVERSAVELGWAPVYAFVGDRSDPTMAIIEDRCLLQDRRFLFTHVDEDVEAADKRVWNPKRFEQMARLRNALLALVRAESPRYFLSLDSDILIGCHTLAGLVQSTERFDAVGGGTWLTPTGELVPNCGWISGQLGLVRRVMEHKGVIPVGIIMAIKLMTPAAYAVDYQTHVQGEDIGWSVACNGAGLTLGWDNRWPSKHVMSPAALSAVDPRVGW